MVSDSVSKKFGIEKSIGFGIENIWYRKKYRILYRKNLVSEKVSDSVSFRFWVSSHTLMIISNNINTINIILNNFMITIRW